MSLPMKLDTLWASGTHTNDQVSNLSKLCLIPPNFRQREVYKHQLEKRSRRSNCLIHAIQIHAECFWHSSGKLACS